MTGLQAGPNWEVIYSLQKRSGDVEKSKPEYMFSIPKGQLILLLKQKTKDIVDRYDLIAAIANAVQIDRLDKNAGKVYYSTPADIVRVKEENTQ